MSEKIYSLLFRLFPARFRARWQDEALELFRDRAGYERGLGPQVRMWFDILCDFAVSLPVAYMRERQALAPAAATVRPGVPSFTMLEDKPIRSIAYLYGTLLSLLILAGIAFMARHAGHFPMRADADSGGITMDPWATGAASDGGGGSTLVLGNGEGSTRVPKPGAVRPARVVVQAGQPAQMPFFDAAEKHRVLLGVADVLKQRYPDSAAAQRLGKSLLSAEGALARTSDPDTFAAALTHQLQAESRDMHFEVAYLRDELRERAEPAVSDAAYRSTMREANCMMAPPAILPHNVGYLKLDWFPEPDVCGDALVSAMKTLSRADSLNYRPARELGRFAGDGEVPGGLALQPARVPLESARELGGRHVDALADGRKWAGRQAGLGAYVAPNLLGRRAVRLQPQDAASRYAGG
jgi:hypothetical protein